MKSILLLLLLASSCLASFGYSRVTIERIWTIDSDGSAYDFTGAVAVNNSQQSVVSITTSPAMDVRQDANGTIWVHRQASGESSSTLRATAIVDIYYDTNITSDPPLPAGKKETTDLTEFNQAMANQAVALGREDSSLATIVNLVNFVHSYVDYDLAYWGRIRSAREVFSERKGVCVEYTHLLISLARSLGFETRYVNGYVLANAWQPHAWAEIYLPGYGWLPADATFGQAGTLDNTHLAINYGMDQASAFDLLVTQDAEARISVREKVRANFLSRDEQGVAVRMDYDENARVVQVELENTRQEYALGAYSFLIPDVYGTSNSSVIVLSPKQVTHRYYPVNATLFSSGLSGIPASASFNDAEDSIQIGSLGTGSGGGGGSSVCAPALLIGLLLWLKLF